MNDENKLLFRLHNKLNFIVIGRDFFQFTIFKILIIYRPNRIIFLFYLINHMITQLLLRIKRIKIIIEYYNTPRILILILKPFFA